MAKQKTQVKKSKMDKAVAIACIVFAVVIVAGLAVSVLGNQGVFVRGTTAISGNDNVEVNSAMMSYFLNDYISTWYNNNYYYIDPYYASLFGMQYSIDMSSSLKTQTLNQNDATYLGATEYIGATWYDYFLGQVVDQVEALVLYAEAAYDVTDKDLMISAEQKEEIDESIKTLKASLKEQKLSFSDVYGKGVKEKDVRDCFELNYIASNFVEYKIEKLEEALVADTTNKEVNEYVEENKSSFYAAECLNFSITESRKDYVSDADYKAAIDAAKAAAEKIAEAKTAEDFIAAIEAYEASKKDSTETSTESETESEDLEAKIEKYKDEFKYSEDTDTEGLDDWLFGETPANVGDANVFTEEGSVTDTAPALKDIVVTEADSDETDSVEADSATETEAVETDSATETGSETETETENGPKLNIEIKDGKYIYPTYTATAYYVVKANGVDKELTHNFAYLVSSEKDLLEKVIAEFKKGEMTIEKFLEVAAVVEKDYNALHEEENHEHTGNELFEYNELENQPDGAFNETYKVLNDWVDAADRADKSLSDIIEVAVDSTNTQYGVMFFENHGYETWYSVALNGDGSTLSGLLTDQLNEWLEEAGKNEPVELNQKALDNITVVPYMTTTDDGHAH